MNIEKKGLLSFNIEEKSNISIHLSDPYKFYLDMVALSEARNTYELFLRLGKEVRKK